MNFQENVEVKAKEAVLYMYINCENRLWPMGYKSLPFLSSMTTIGGGGEKLIKWGPRTFLRTYFFSQLQMLHISENRSAKVSVDIKCTF